MKKKLIKNKELILTYLNATEIEDSVIYCVLKVSDWKQILEGIITGIIKASTFELKNAIHILGKLQEQDAIPSLLEGLNKWSKPIRLHIFLALARIGPNEEAQSTLKTVAWDKKAEPQEVAYALQALATKATKTLVEEFIKNPPAHLEDSGVWESFNRLRVKTSVRPY